MTLFAMHSRRRWVAVSAALTTWCFFAPSLARGQAPEPPPADAADDAQPSPDDAGVFLPTDRIKERQLDRARRLLASEQWADAVTLLDELLADDRDAFVASPSAGGTRCSLRAEAARMIASLPAAGRDAYTLLFRTRADRALADAVARADAAAIVAVARRWFGTPAGRRAAGVAAQLAMEAGDPHAARAWLERIALATGPAEAWLARPAVTGGNSPDGWPQPHGLASRNAVVDASRPLLVPRYRVPLTRHPEESRLLESRRRSAVADGVMAGPAGSPIAVGNAVVVQTPLGILGIGFETGKRLWVRSAVSAATDVEASLGRSFDDATSGGLSSDGVRVFAVESPPELLVQGPEGTSAFGGGVRIGRGAGTGNMLTAYDTSDSAAVSWRLPARPRAAGEEADEWFLGAPLVVGDDLFTLVESKGQLRLDVLEATTGATRWSQPLADLEERQSAANPEAVTRRLAGLTPAAGEGVLVCPLGAGAVVAIDLTTRSLLWAHSYRVAVKGDLPGAAGARLRALAVDVSEPAATRGGDPWPVIADGRVLLSPYDTDEVICLQLRDGRAAWPRPLRGRRQIAGVVAGRAILVGAEGVDAVDLATGRVQWTRPHPPGVRPSGRGLLTPTRLFLPVDAPGVLELAVDDGRIVGRHAVRGGGVPGNLVAVRGEVMSRGLDSLDVYHQAADLEPKVETARLDDARRPWADYWSGQLELDDGEVAAAVDRIRVAAGSIRVPPHAVAQALVHAMRRDRSAAIDVWRAWNAAGESAAADPDVLRGVIDGCLRAGDDATAWQAGQRLLAAAAGAAQGTLIPDPFEAGLEVDPDRWLRGRLAELAGRATPELRDEIAAWARRGLPSTPSPADAAPAAPDDPRADEWPLGRVEARRGRRLRADQSGGLGSQVVSLPLVSVVDAAIPGVAVSYDMQHRRLHVLDGFGRRVVEPLPLDATPLMPWVNQMSPIEPAVVGRTLVVRSATGVTAFDLAADVGESRVLWKFGVRPAPGRGTISMQGVTSGRVARNGAVPLGRRITEVDDAGAARGASPPVARPAGVLVTQGRTLTLLDPTTGRTLWERQGLPRVVEWIADDQAACGCTADGRGSPVISMEDGRLLHTIDLPGRRQRLATRGRMVVAVVPGDDGPLAARVRIDRVDPLSREARPLGEFAGESRATMAGDGRLAVLATDGTLTLLDVDAGRAIWATRLPVVPARVDAFHVLAWRDRYLVFAGEAEVASFDDSATISPLQTALVTSESTEPLSGSIWAVARDDGQHLWQSPATVRRHCLVLSQPADLPVLVFCRQSTNASGSTREMGVLCLDKRTGHAVLDEPRLPVPPHLFVGCMVVGDPKAHSIAIHGAGAETPAVTIGFTGRPQSPQPPHQASGRPPVPGRVTAPSEPDEEPAGDR
jgi:outer membrane protein assembly factor BamB